MRDRLPLVGAAQTAVLLALVGAVAAGCGGPTPPADDAAPASAEASERRQSPAIAEGFEALRSGDLEAAKAAYMRVMPGMPDFPEALRGLGVVAMQENDVPTALAVLEQLIAIEPGSDDAWVLLGRARFRDGRPEDAELAALRAIELNSDRADARYDVALYRLAQDRLPEAIVSYERAMNVDLDHSGAASAYSNLVTLRERSGDDPELAYAAAFFANALGDTAAERDALEAYLELAPDGPAAGNARTRLAELDGES